MATKKLGTQDKVRARTLRRNLLHTTKAFTGSDLGDRADRVGPEMVRLVLELAELEGWDSNDGG